MESRQAKEPGQELYGRAADDQAARRVVSSALVRRAMELGGSSERIWRDADAGIPSRRSTGPQSMTGTSGETLWRHAPPDDSVTAGPLAPWLYALHPKEDASKLASCAGPIT